MDVTFQVYNKGNLRESVKSITPEALFTLLQSMYEKGEGDRRAGWSDMPDEVAELEHLLRKPHTLTYKMPIAPIGKLTFTFTLTPKQGQVMSHLNEIASRLLESAAGGPGMGRGLIRRPSSSAEVKKELTAYDKESKALLKTFLVTVKSKGGDIVYATKWFSEAIEENREFLEDGLNEAGRAFKGKGGPGGYYSAEAALTPLRKLTYKQFAEDYASEQEHLGIQKVRDAGKAISEDPAKKIALLKKLGLSGEEFHALCIMIKQS